MIPPDGEHWLWAFIYDRSETYAPGQGNYRRLIFAYPIGRVPQALRCGNAVFEVPRQG